MVELAIVERLWVDLNSLLVDLRSAEIKHVSSVATRPSRGGVNLLANGIVNKFIGP